MKKSLVALAALAAVGAASAQSSVTMYGIVDIGYGTHTTTTRDGTGSIKTRGVMDGGNSSTRIGFRGTEDLGGGLKANFVLEQGLLATGNSMFGARAGAAGHQIAGFAASSGQVSGAGGSYALDTNRQAYVGLASDAMGTVNIGYQYTVAYELSSFSGYMVGAEGTVGAEKAHLHGQSGVGGSRGNMIQYISPNFGGGFVARAQYGAGAGRESVESTTAGVNGLTTDKARRMALMLQYANGPLSVAAAYTNYKVTQGNVSPTTGLQLAAGTTTSIYGVTTANTSTATLSGQPRTANLLSLGGSYDFGVAKIGATYNRGKNGGAATSPVGSANGTAGFNSDYRAYQVGVAVPFGAIVPYLAYGRAYTLSNDPAGTGPVGNAAATGRTEDYKTWQAGVRYSLSKRTTAYAIYGRVRNEAAAMTGSTSFYNDRKFITGVMHTF